MVTVYNLRTGEETQWGPGVSARDAVILAYRQLERQDVNWWREPSYPLPLLEAGRVVACGDYSALRRDEQPQLQPEPEAWDRPPFGLGSLRRSTT